ncbi:hypothetical protein SEHO0A_03082 [Salmonella enterica subsp. houtenae str. ATCC BAA-1581]|nr:hypothetical protein SEHO0A_03082 [Salmonella enterica subsp. houtenae str. ATCC BAA-1581]
MPCQIIRNFCVYPSLKYTSHAGKIIIKTVPVIDSYLIIISQLLSCRNFQPWL